jgi:hypothetical protein
MTTTTAPAARKLTATDRRVAALRTIQGQVRTVGKDGRGQLTSIMLIWDRAQLAGMIRELATLGRTDRWTGTIENWARQVEAADDTTLMWAFDQYCTYACHAAD